MNIRKKDVSFEKVKEVHDRLNDTSIKSVCNFYNIKKRTVRGYERLYKEYMKQLPVYDVDGGEVSSISIVNTDELRESEESFLKSIEEFISKKSNVLVIGDLHEPFTRKDYLQFCIDTYNKYECTDVVFIGDIIDNHFSSFHEIDPDGHSAGKELELAINNLNKWQAAFPYAKVCLGNHDLIPARKAFNAGLSTKWIKTVEEVLSFDGWEYDEHFIINDVKYTHGTGRKARFRAKDDFTNVVQGHYHSESYIEHYVGTRFRFFAMQVGCGVDNTSYAVAYGKNFKRMHINVGVVLDNGEQPILEYMKL